MQNHTLVFDEARFWAKVDKDATCWNWTAATARGYGRFSVLRDGKRIVAGAHRIAYEMSGRTIPDGMVVDHACRNRTCVNPGHMRVVTNKQNLENRSQASRTAASGVRGVSLHKQSGLWRAVATSGGIRHDGGYHRTISEAEIAVIAIRNKIFTHNDADRA